MLPTLSYLSPTKKNRSKQWLVKKLPFNYVPLAHSTFILHIYLTFTSVSSGTWTHTVLHYYFLRIACLPISTCLHYYIQKIHYPKNPIRVTPIFLPFYYFPFNPFHHSKIHYPINILYYPTKPTLLLTTQKTTLIFIFILHYTY